MSHNVVLSGAPIKDLALLAAIVKDMTKGKASLVKGQKNFRTYPGQPDQCDHCIKLDGRYDVGIKKNADGTFGLIADFTILAHQENSPFVAQGVNKPQWDMGQLFNNTAQNGYDQRCAQYAVGGLMQEYVLRQAEEQAAILGRSTQRIAAKNGTVALQIMER